MALGFEVVAGSPAGVRIGVISTVFMAAVYGGLVFPMRYGVGCGELIIRHGVVRQRVRLDAIREVRPTRNPISAPALSLDRLEVLATGGPFSSPSVIISPADQEGFLTALAQASGLAWHGDRLIRPALPA